MTTLFEIIELPNGEIALRRAGEGGEPLVSIRFSPESLHFIHDAKLEVAKAMIEAGLEAAGEAQAGNLADESELVLDDEYVLH